MFNSTRSSMIYSSGESAVEQLHEVPQLERLFDQVRDTDAAGTRREGNVARECGDDDDRCGPGSGAHGADEVLWIEIERHPVTNDEIEAVAQGANDLARIVDDDD